MAFNLRDNISERRVLALYEKSYVFAFNSTAKKRQSYYIQLSTNSLADGMGVAHPVRK
jgi:hypothetical protein